MQTNFREFIDKYFTIPEHAFVTFSGLLVKLPGSQIKEYLEYQDNDFLISLSNKSLALEHFEVCAIIANMLQERIK